jgi:hypothetical protein
MLFQLMILPTLFLKQLVASIKLIVTELFISHIQHSILKKIMFEVYDKDVDISKAMRYTAIIYKLDADKRKYYYASFYLPSTKKEIFSRGQSIGGVNDIILVNPISKSSIVFLSKE